MTDQEEKRIRREMWRRQVMGEMRDMLRDSARESVEDLVRIVGWMLAFFVILMLFSPPQ